MATALTLREGTGISLSFQIPGRDAKREVEALIKALEQNRAQLKRTRQKVENLETATQPLQYSRFEPERKRKTKTELGRLKNGVSL